MNIEPGTSYVNARGEEAWIRGYCAPPNVEFLWSVQGDWYTREGKRLGYWKTAPDTWAHLVLGDEHPLNLILEVTSKVWP